MTSIDPLCQFFDWESPLVPQLVERILAMDEPQSVVIVVPTMNAGRRLRLALAESVSRSGDGAFFPPRVFTPEAFFRPTDTKVATKAEMVIAWADVLQKIAPAEVDQFFPQGLENRSFSWALSAAKPLMNACELVAEADRSVADIAELSAEPERWVQLAEIERRVAGKLNAMGLGMSTWAKRKRAHEPELPPGCDRLIIAAVPDPVRLSLRAWQHLADSSVKVEVWVHAPEALKENFDAWGVPKADYWSHAKIDFGNGNDAIVVSGHAAEMSRQVVEKFGTLGASSDECAVGLCDADFAASVEGEFHSHGWSVFDPNGRAVSACGLMLWLGTLRELLSSRPGFDHAQRFLRMAESTCIVEEAGSQSLARALDRLREESIPDTLQQAVYAKVRGNKEGGRDKNKQFAEFAQVALRKLHNALDEMRESKLTVELLKLVEALVAKGYDDGAGGKVVVALVEALEEVQAVEEHLQSPTDALDLLLDLLRGKRVTGDREDAVIDLQGWLELPYETAPNLALVGVHEGIVPENLNEDALLPEGLRRKLGLRDRAQRMARDSYLLSALSASRSDGGDLQCHVIKATPGGDARVPSRLLMRCGDEELASRVNHCFAHEGDGGGASPVWQRGDWMLNFQRKSNPYEDWTKSLSPSALKRYLSCPTRFYFERIMKMDRIDPVKRELAANDFGTLVHAVLETFGADPKIKDSVNASEIADYFHDVLDADVEARFGRHLALPLLVQVDSARERLRSFAKEQAESRAEGWKILEVEKRVENWDFHGVPLTMTIDRIEQHESDGRYRVMDFKTSAKAKDPQKVHFVAIRENEELIAAALDLPARGGKMKAHKWQDVQLPLYAKWVADHYNGGKLDGVVTAYGNLPKAVGETDISDWQITEEEMVSATEWVVEAARRIQSGMFWPPGELTNEMKIYDEFHPLAPDGLDHALQPELVEFLKGG